MANIYELTKSIKMLQELLETEEDTQIIKEALDGYEAQLEEKADNYARVIKNLEASMKGLKEESKRLSDRAKTIENNIKYLKSSLQNSMITLDKKKFKTDLFSFGIQKNPPSCNITGEVTQKYLIKQEPKIDKKAIIADLKAGKELGFAELTQGESLRIR